mmetsp:Transcript_15810/g.31961  ORF Transcript_15810/g.31961 Transcript_15810/m.31961 type:complete len:240 (-) Transcript_15810:115-834(-)|eukprot:CAMPEP_0119074960 /NCGR_PEP_ID=MMETSP1178-20130426/75461_1 /TAXON_ID=33656 /ORGANISM="unid sp, Strain CCMP2000" /LENGTH=239 /DNA_ID=CAMNT_0007057151 /DNA_START=13 /DNA_END=732 /DNA_ORIENTATION=-
MAGLPNWMPPAEFLWSFVLISGAWLTFCALIYLGITAYQGKSKYDDAPWVNAVRNILEDESTYPANSAIDLPVEIMPHLLLGDKACTAKPDLLRKRGVTHVLNVAGRAGREVATHQALREAGLELQSIENVEDDEEYPLIYTHQVKVSDFIRGVERAGGKCLIHGVEGINRSGALAVAELMLHGQLPLLEAVRQVKQARRVVLRNQSFQRQLVTLARSHGLLGDRPSAMASTQAGKKVL